MFRGIDVLEIRSASASLIRNCTRLGIGDLKVSHGSYEAVMEYCLGSSSVSSVTGVRSFHWFLAGFDPALLDTLVKVSKFLHGPNEYLPYDFTFERLHFTFESAGLPTQSVYASSAHWCLLLQFHGRALHNRTRGTCNGSRRLQAVLVRGF